jgi:hypothetical protein
LFWEVNENVGGVIACRRKTQNGVGFANTLESPYMQVQGFYYGVIDTD